MNEPKINHRDRAAAFVGALRRIRSDRGKMAALRRGLTDNARMHADAWPVVAGLGGDIAQPVFLTVAALYATHPEELNGYDFGETCRRIALGPDKQVLESFERRFRRLIASEDLNDLAAQLRAWVRLASSKDVGINYESLFLDLYFWPYSADDIRVRWARSFWRSAPSTMESHAGKESNE